jgi:ribosomal protein S18 acetylase RimI-like enzyme
LGAAFQVRRARPEELPACADLYVRVLRETFTWIPPERHRREDFLRAAREEEVFVAVGPDGRILGLAALYRPQSFLHSLYVDVRGKGVGKALLDHASRAAPGALSLKVQAPNMRAQAFYAREGFRCVERGHDPGSDIAWLRLARAKP